MSILDDHNQVFVQLDLHKSVCQLARLAAHRAYIVHQMQFKFDRSGWFVAGHIRVCLDGIEALIELVARHLHECIGFEQLLIGEGQHLGLILETGWLLNLWIVNDLRGVQLAREKEEPLCFAARVGVKLFYETLVLLLTCDGADAISL